MIVKVFILGRPGTGKSTAARQMMTVAHRHGWYVKHIDDYSILERMSKEHKHRGRFSKPSNSFGGFDVIDVNVFHEALSEVQQMVLHSLTQSLWTGKLVLIEFARGEYLASLARFEERLLGDSYFLFLEADLERCIERIQLHAQRHGDHFISEEAMRKYYSHSDVLATAKLLSSTYGLDEERVKVLYTNTEEQIFLDKVARFVENTINREKVRLEADKETGEMPSVTQETEPLLKVSPCQKIIE